MNRAPAAIGRGTMNRMRMKVDSEGPYCPNCGGRAFRQKSALEWGSAKVACIACGKGLQPASRADRRRARDEQ